MGKGRIVLFCIAALVAGACSSDGNSKGGASATTTGVTVADSELQAEASTLTDALIAQKWDDVVSHFDPKMHVFLTPAGLKTAWGQVVTTYGPYKSRGTTARSLAVGPKGVVAFDTPLTFGSEAMKSRISFDQPDGRVAGLFILKASVP